MKLFRVLQRRAGCQGGICMDWGEGGSRERVLRRHCKEQDYKNVAAVLVGMQGEGLLCLKWSNPIS